MKIVSLRFDDDREADQFAAAARARDSDTGHPLIAYDACPEDPSWQESYNVPASLSDVEVRSARQE